MGKAEDIYRAVRNNKIAAMEYVRASDDDLSAGVARIRERLVSGAAPRARKKGRLLLFKIGIPAAALTAAAAFLLVFYLPHGHSEETAWVPRRLNTLQRLKQHDVVAVENKFSLQALSGVEVSAMRSSDGVNHIHVFGGTVLISRTDAAFASVVHTPNREYRLTGTRFLLSTSGGADLVYMFTGSLHMRGGDHDTELRANTAAALRTHGSADEISQKKLPELLKSRADLQKLLQGTSLKEQAAPAAKKQQLAQSAARFKKGDCVIYYRSNEKRHGKIHARDAAGYAIWGTSGLEPGRWREGDIFPTDCE